MTNRNTGKKTKHERVPMVTVTAECSTYPSDSYDGEHISFTERQVLFIGGLEVVLCYTLCAWRPGGLGGGGGEGGGGGWKPIPSARTKLRIRSLQNGGVGEKGIMLAVLIPFLFFC